jgi:hypothetical protein
MGSLEMKIISSLVVLWLELFGLVLRRHWGWDRTPRSFQEFFIFAIMLWVIWNIRNKMGIEKRFQSSSNEVFFKIFNFTQKWKILLGSGDEKFLEGKLMIMKGWLEAFWM